MAQPYMNPYLAGIGLGLVLLAAFVLIGRGLGASGAFNSTIAWLVSLVAPGYARSNEFLAAYLERGHAPAEGVARLRGRGRLRGRAPLGPARRAGRRWRSRRVRGSRSATRLAFAFVGGGLMAIGAAFARGCTSGQALTGGALLNLGSWAFMMCVFGGAYAVALLVRRQWR